MFRLEPCASEALTKRRVVRQRLGTMLGNATHPVKIPGAEFCHPSRELVDFYANHREFKMRDNIKTEKKKYAWSEMLKKISEVAAQIHL